MDFPEGNVCTLAPDPEAFPLLGRPWAPYFQGLGGGTWEVPPRERYHLPFVQVLFFHGKSSFPPFFLSSEKCVYVPVRVWLDM